MPTKFLFLSTLFCIFGCNTLQAGYACDEDVIAPNLARQLQGKLKSKGFDPGPIDGVWGPASQAALYEFKENNNLGGSDELDQRTVNALFGENAGITVHRVRLDPVTNWEDPEERARYERAYERAKQSGSGIVIIENVEGMSDEDYKELCETLR